MKKAFTLLELVFVLVIIGIIAAVMIPEMKSNGLREAAMQMISHIRYTQHLAMVDDRFDLSDSEWYKEKWQFIYGKSDSSSTKDTDGYIAYSIFSDWAGSSTGNPDLSEMAKDPMTNSKYLSGGFSGALDTYDPEANKKMNLGLSYGITDVEFSGGCRADTMRISFDHLGRPIRDPLTTYTQSYDTATGSGTTNRLIQDACEIKLINPSEGSATIKIEAETGYTYIVMQ